MDSVNVVMLDTERYQELLEAERYLQCLQEVGVDNWDGNTHALKILEQWNAAE